MSAGAIRRFVEVACFSFACVASLGALCWYLVTISGHIVNPHNTSLVWLAAGLFACAMCVTFQQRPVRNPWMPVLTVTAKRVRASQVLLVVIAANFAAWTLAIFIARARSSTRMLVAELASLILLYAVYMSVHWAFRPQNLFASWILDFFSNPLFYVLNSDRRRNR